MKKNEKQKKIKYIERDLSKSEKNNIEQASSSLSYERPRQQITDQKNFQKIMKRQQKELIDEDECEESAESNSEIAYIDKATLAKLIKTYQQNQLEKKISYHNQDSYYPNLYSQSKSVPIKPKLKTQKESRFRDELIVQQNQYKIQKIKGIQNVKKIGQNNENQIYYNQFQNHYFQNEQNKSRIIQMGTRHIDKIIEQNNLNNLVNQNKQKKKVKFQNNSSYNEQEEEKKENDYIGDSEFEQKIKPQKQQQKFRNKKHQYFKEDQIGQNLSNLSIFNNYQDQDSPQRIKKEINNINDFHQLQNENFKQKRGRNSEIQEKRKEQRIVQKYQNKVKQLSLSMNDQTEQLILISDTNSNKIQNPRDMDKIVMENNENKKKIEELNNKIDDMKRQAEAQEKFMNMVVHDMRNPSEAINNGLKQAKELMKKEIDSIMKDIKSLYKKNQTSFKKQKNNFNLQRNLSMQPQIFQGNQSIQQNSLSRLQSLHYQQLARKSISIGKSSPINSGNSKDREQKNNSQDGSGQKISSLHKSSFPNDSYKHAQIIKSFNERVEQNQQNHNQEERKSVSFNNNDNNQILSGQQINQINKQSLQNRQNKIQVEEEKKLDQHNHSQNINLNNIHQINIQNGRSSPSCNIILKNNQASNILSNLQSNQQLSNQINQNIEEGQINSFHIQSQPEKDLIQILNDLTFNLNNYNQQISQPINQEREIRDLRPINNIINQNQIAENRAQQDQQEDDGKYDFNEDDMQEAIQPAGQNQNQIQSQQQQQNLINISNFQQSSLVINQPRDICPREGSKYLKRKKSQNQRLQQSINRPQRRQEQIKFIQKEVVVYKEDLILKMDRSIQTEQEDVSNQSQNIHSQNIIQEVEKLLQSKQLMEFLEVYKSYSELTNKIQQQQNKRIKPQELVTILIDNLNKKDYFGIKSRQLSRLISSKQLQPLQNIQQVSQQIDEIEEGSQSISCLSINQGDKESNLQIEALKRVQNIRISNQHQMRRIKNSNLNQESNVLQSNLIDSEQYDHNLKSLDNQDQIINKSQKKRITVNRKNVSSLNINQLKPNFNKNNENQNGNNENENKFLLAVLEKLKKVLHINKTVEYYIQNSISSAGIIANLTEYLLTLAKIKNNVFELNMEQNVNLLDLVNEAYQVLSFNSENKKLGLFLEFDLNNSNLLQNVTTDKRRIVQILLNFLSNSIKFTQEGGIIKIALKIMEKVSLGEPNIKSQKEKDQDECNEETKKLIQLQIEIQDTGAGISKENICKLFTDFAKLNEHKQMNAKGTGLGLSICKQIVEQMGGKVSVYSKVGVGTKFVITLTLNAYDKVIQKEISNSSNEFSIVNEKIVYCHNFQNNFEVDDEFDQKVEVSSDESNKIQRLFKQSSESLKIFKFSTQKNKNLSDKHQSTINQIMKSIKERKPKESQININTSFIDNFSQIELSENNSQNDIINENLMNFKPLKYAIMDSLLEQNEDEFQDEAYVLRKMKNNLNQSNLIEYLNMSQINYAANDDASNLQIYVEKSNSQINNQVQQIAIQNSQNKILSPDYQNFQKEYRNSNFSSFSNSIMKKDSSDHQRNYMNNQNLLNSLQQSENNLNSELNKIVEQKESSSLQISFSNEKSNSFLASSRQKQISSQVLSIISVSQKKDNLFENEDLQDYLENNVYVKEAIDISMKFPRKKLQFLIANDDSYSLFFISTSVSQLKNVSLLDKAEDGQIALELVQKNVTLDDIQNNFYDAIFLDLDMPHLNGFEACKQIQQHYYSRAKDNFEINQINQDQLQVKMNQINFPDRNTNEEILSKIKKLQEKKTIPDWIKGLKRIYDIYSEINQKINEELYKSESNEIENTLMALNETKEHVFKVFNILYTNQRYMSLQLMKRPFIFAYSALTNSKVLEETRLNGFDKCVDSPLNKLKIEGLIDESIEMWAYQLTKIMLENIGPVPKINELIDINQVMNSQKVSSGEIYKSVFKHIQNGQTKKHSSMHFMQQIQECAISSEIINDSVEEQKNNFSLGIELNASQRQQIIKQNQKNDTQQKY